MLLFHASNYTENLADAMAHIMAERPLADPFEAELVLIQSAGMGTWLNQRLAQELGAAVNVDSVHPASFVWKLIARLQNKPAQRGLFEKTAMRWEILRLLPAKLEQPDYAPIKTYLDALPGGPDQSAKRMFSVAETIADAFDAYLNYRPEWIEAWEGKGSVSPDLIVKLGAQAWRWQGDLWRSLYPQIQPAQRNHRVAQLAWLMEHLEHSDLAQQALLPKRLFIFGLQTLPPAWLSLFVALSRHVEIHWLAMNPSRFYWGDIQHPKQAARQQRALLEKGLNAELAGDLFIEQNTLLASWGAQGRAYVSLIYGLEGHSGFVESPADLFESPMTQQTEALAASTALQALQNDVFELTQQGHELAKNDRSLGFAQCHSRLREVEALHDYLLTLLAENPDLEPRDIIVMMPNVEAYAPLVQAIFSREVSCADGSTKALPYGISDQSSASETMLIEALGQMLRPALTRFTLTEVGDWLEIEAIAVRFELNDDEVVHLRQWLRKLNVRWGLDPSHRNRLIGGSQARAENSWSRVRDRLLQGMMLGAMGDNEASMFVSCGLPEEPASLDEQKLVGKLCRLLDSLAAIQEWGQKCLPPQQALQCLSQLLHDLIDFDQLDPALERLLTQQLDTLRQEFPLEHDEPIRLDLMIDAWLQALSSTSVSQRFLSGRINFCTLMPMRSIPFKVVAMLGMNEGEYPRQQDPNGFDLMRYDQSRLGDRSRRDDDRYLFLEALLSARQALYISYIGFSPHDNSPRFPSVLVAELRDYLAAHFVCAGDDTLPQAEAGKRVLEQLTQSHRLQAFHPVYFESDFDAQAHQANLPQSFAREWLTYGKAHERGSCEAPVALTEPVPSSYRHEELIARLTRPQQCYYQALGVVLSSLNEPDPEAEPFYLDGLQHYLLKNELAETWLQDQADAEQQVLARWQAQDRMPRPPLAEWEFEHCRAAVQPMQQALHDAGQLMAYELDWQHAGQDVYGSVWANAAGRVELNLSGKAEGAFWPAWIRHVLWNCSASTLGVSGASVLIGPAQRIRFEPLEQEIAESYAIALLDLANRVTAEPMLFAPRTLYHALLQTEAKARTALLHTGEGFGRPGEIYEAYWQRLMVERGEVVDSLEELLRSLENHPLVQQVRAQREGIKEETW